MSGRYILALDQGTTSSRSIIFDASARPVAVAQEEIDQRFPQSGWVEHDPMEIWRKQLSTASEVLHIAGIPGSEIAGIGITNQRETTVVWDRKSGRPIYNAIVWQDRRTAEFCADLKNSHGPLISARTGLEIDAYFSASKLRWILDTVDQARSMAEAGDLAFGTVDTWLIWNLTDGRCHVTDPSNASRTMLYSLESGDWDNDLLEIFRIPRSVLPDIVPSSGLIAECTKSELRGIPISGIAGDQQAALFGQTCFATGEVKNTYGTGCFMLMNTGPVAIRSNSRLITTVAWQVGKEISYALEGSVFIGGAVVQWLRDGLGMIDSARQIEQLANQVSNNGGVFFVPAFAGLGAPYWDQNARGMIIGLTRGTGRAHIARAALEAIALQTAELMTAMDRDAGSPVTELRVDGGAAANDTLLQIQADVLGIPVLRSAVTETTALGAACLAGLAAGLWKDQAEISTHWRVDRAFEPSMGRDAAAALMRRWQEAARRSFDWA